jgi:hypothetical protein
MARRLTMIGEKSPLHALSMVGQAASECNRLLASIDATLTRTVQSEGVER